MKKESLVDKMKENLKAWEAVKAIEEGKKLQIGSDGHWTDFGDGYVNGDCQNVLYLINDKCANFRIKPPKMKRLYIEDLRTGEKEYILSFDGYVKMEEVGAMVSGNKFRVSVTEHLEINETGYNKTIKVSTNKT
tara:strand:+ start:58 stop:459 length:402 start_codon:yes stop_codon:yes gene_type:complete